MVSKMHMHYVIYYILYSFQAQEISHLIACQPTALKAVRLQALIPSYPDTKDKGDTLDKLDVSIEFITSNTEQLFSLPI